VSVLITPLRPKPRLKNDRLFVGPEPTVEPR
jgi:hypothetical protein